MAVWQSHAEMDRGRFRDTLPRPAARSPRLAPAIPSTITRPPFQFASSLPVFDSATNCPSNPIAHRVRRKRQRLPPSLLIENASDRDSARPQSLPEAFPIKASDHSSIIRRPAPKRGLPTMLPVSFLGSAKVFHQHDARFRQLSLSVEN